MRTFIFAAALVLGTSAIAQTAGTTSQNTGAQGTMQPSGETVDDPSEATGPQGETQQGTDPNGTATAPSGMNQGAMTQGNMQPSGNASGMMSNMPMQSGAQASYPACSRTVTDRCVQTYERGVRRGRARR
ncbi:MAG TPA: hypothetical protein VEZ48_08910 [Sphingomonadaceae bacterium]|nr:hypothetical protein [Sphingomonadaceae bacterium]